MNTYSYRFYSSCPSDGARIEYRLSIATHEKIMAEDIVGQCATFDRSYQEDIADSLAARFGGRQEITAIHNNVEITTVRGTTA